MISKSNEWTLRALALAYALAAPALALAQAQDFQDAQPLPEPEILALLGVAGVAIFVARWMRRK